MRVLAILLAFITIFAAQKALTRFSIRDGGKCGNNPNCVSTLDPRPGRHMAPWRYEGSRHEAKARLESILRDWPRVTVYHGGVDYMHAEFRSPVLRMVNDVEFYFPMYEPIIHFRSSSRVGIWDFGRNRRRMTLLGERFLKPARP